MKEFTPLKRPLLERLVYYCHFVQERERLTDAETVSSAQMAAYAGLDESQVRKDLAVIGVKGRPRIGYRTRDVESTVREALGFERSYRAVVVGAGKLGGAIISYPGFAKYGLEIAALIDADPRKTGTVVAGLPVRPLERLGEVVREQKITLGILTVPREAAQEIADRLVCAGVRAIWNFAPTWLNLPEHVHVRHEHLSVGLAELAYHLSRESGE